MSDTNPAPFSRTGVLAILVAGFLALGAVLYLLGTGVSGLDDSNNGGAHAAAKGLNGYSALVSLIEADGFDVELSRKESGLETGEMLVLTPPAGADPEELARLLYKRRDIGPTLVILPKWRAVPANRIERLEEPDKAKTGWVVLQDMRRPAWTGTEFAPLAFKLEQSAPQSAQTTAASPGSFRTIGPIEGIAGTLPGNRGWHATGGSFHTPLIVDAQDRPIALGYRDPGSDEGPNWVIFLIEPDLVNNWGLADETRALAALSVIRFMSEDYFDRVVFDLTLNGFGGSMNLLTFAFRPPFLAATICLVLAMLILGWRAFFRFGPALAPLRETAFGKAQLVANGADLIVRGQRFELLKQPYAALSARRLARRLGLATGASPPTHTALEAALKARGDESGSFIARSSELTSATSAEAIVNAALSLHQQASRRPPDQKEITPQ